MDTQLMQILAALTQPQPQPGLLGGGLRTLPMVPSNVSVAPWGVRYAGGGAKGNGYFGMIGRPDGNFSSELSAESDFGEYPLLVPTLNRSEIDHLISGGKPTDDIYRKAEDHARTRIKNGLSPFAMPNELRYPLPTE